MNEKGTLFLVATPIGNLSDITIRAVKTLETVDLIAAEDTRQTLKLLNHLEIKKSMISYYEHNKKSKGSLIINELIQGKNVALVSDAGTPGISDPGEDLVKLAYENDITVTMIPGPVAMIAGVVLSGMPTGRFTFEGFLPMNKKTRKERLRVLSKEERTMIFYEAPHKLIITLKDMYEAWGNRKIVFCRELTKKFEEIIRSDILKAIEKFGENQPRGEFVVVVEGKEISTDEPTPISENDILAMVSKLIDQGFSKKEAIKEVAKKNNLAKREVYGLMIEKQ